MDKKELILSYIKANVAPILVDFLSGSDLSYAVVLKADTPVSELSGHYEGTEYLPPEWYNKLNATDENVILVIDKIDTIPKDQQMKFGEILKYRKISTFELPASCVIIVTANKINEETINEEVLSLVARI